MREKPRCHDTESSRNFNRRSMSCLRKDQDIDSRVQTTLQPAASLQEANDGNTQIRLDIWNVNTTKDNGNNLIDLAHGSGLIYPKLNWTNHHTASLRYVPSAIQATYSRPKSKEIQTAVRCHAAVQFILNQGDKSFKFFHRYIKTLDEFQSWLFGCTMWKKQNWQAQKTLFLNSDQETRLHQVFGWRSVWSSQWSSDAASSGSDDRSATINNRMQQPCHITSCFSQFSFNDHVYV